MAGWLSHRLTYYMLPALLLGLSACQTADAKASPQTRPQAQTRAASRLGVVNLAEHPISHLRIEDRDGKQACLPGECPAKGTLAARPTIINVSNFVRVSFTGDRGMLRRAEFTDPTFECGEPAETIYVFVGYNDQILIRSIVRGDYKELDRWHVPDDRVGYIRPEAMKEPELIGVGPRDPFFDTAEALIRYPGYDDLQLVRRGTWPAVGGAWECNGRTVRQLPDGESLRVESVTDRAVSFAGPRGVFSVTPAADDPPIPGRAAHPAKITTQPADSRLQAADDAAVALSRATGFVGAAEQSIETSNWSAGPIRSLRIEAGGRTYTWRGAIRPGGGGAGITPVREVEVTGTVRVSYLDSAGRRRTATFHNVPSEEGTVYPHRDFVFDGSGRVLLHTFDLTDEGRTADKWCVPDEDGPADKQIQIPQLLGIRTVSSMTGAWEGLVRYGRNDCIDTYSDGDMLGGRKDDFVQHETPEGEKRYRIEVFEPTKMVLVRGGRRIEIPLRVPATRPAAK